MKITLTLFFAVLFSVLAYSQDKAKKEVKTIITRHIKKQLSN